MSAQVDAKAERRRELEAAGHTVWDTEELKRDFDVKGFMAPFVVVRRKADGKLGSLEFEHNPRLYYAFRED